MQGRRNYLDNPEILAQDVSNLSAAIPDQVAGETIDLGGAAPFADDLCADERPHERQLLFLLLIGAFRRLDEGELR